MKNLYKVIHKGDERLSADNSIGIVLYCATWDGKLRGDGYWADILIEFSSKGLDGLISIKCFPYISESRIIAQKLLSQPSEAFDTWDYKKWIEFLELNDFEKHKEGLMRNLMVSQ